ncbi:MAG: dual specificity protein phosphatase [archaeon]
MAIKIYENLYVGDESSCFYNEKEGWAAIHACKSPCHQRIVGYKGNLNPRHPNYLIKELENHLALNMVDMNTPLSPKFTNPIFSKALEFIKKHISDKNVLVHCNVGVSRSPAIALVYLAKVAGRISNDSYDDAKNEFSKRYPAYNPGPGIDFYLRRNWESLDT